jgi:hypothetical protein
VAFPECFIEQPSAAQILSATSLALDWEIGRHQTCRRARGRRRLSWLLR